MDNENDGDDVDNADDDDDVDNENDGDDVDNEDVHDEDDGVGDCEGLDCGPRRRQAVTEISCYKMVQKGLKIVLLDQKYTFLVELGGPPPPLTEKIR